MLKIPRKWFLVVIGVADWREKAQILPFGEFTDLTDVTDRFLSRTHKAFRKRGALVGSLLWSQENLAPMFLLEATSMNEKFLKEQRIIFDNVVGKIIDGLSPEERQSALGKNIQELGLEGRVLILDSTLPVGNELFPTDNQLTQIFSDAFNSELLTIKRAEHDFNGRKQWLGTLESVLSRELINEVGPIKKLRSAKEIVGKRQYDRHTPGDFEKIVRVLSEAVPYRASLFEIGKLPSTSIDDREPLGHIIIQYLSTEGDFPIKLDQRSTTHERLGRKLTDLFWVQENNIKWKDLDKLAVYAKEMMYDKVEKVIIDVGGIKFDNLWTERDLSNNIFFLSKFSFTEDILKRLKDFLADPRKLLEEHIGAGTTALYEVWQKAGLHFNILIFAVKGLDRDEDIKLSNWIKALKDKQTIGPNYSAEKEVIEARHYRPL